jgi:hypothetical protein
MDWTLTGALVGVAVLATTVGYELFVITRPNPEPPKYQVTAVLIPTRERPVVNANSNIPAVVYDPAPQTKAPRVSDTAEYPQYPSRVDIPPPVGSRPKDHSPPPDYSNSAHSEVRPPPQLQRPQPPPPQLQLQRPQQPQPQPQPINSDAWQVQTTPKAGYMNLGGHVDKNGVVDSTASPYLRDALMKHKNYPKLPAQIQAYINAPNINLAKIAAYRALLGIDDKEMEEKQGVKFIRLATTRGIEINSPGAIDFDAPPIDLSPLERMDFDLRLRMTPSFVL